MSVKIDGKSNVVTAAVPGVVAAAYATGDLIGTKITLAEATQEARTGVIMSVVLVDQAKQNAAVDVIFFGADPSATTFTDNGALDMADADALNICGGVKIAATDYFDFADNSFANPAAKAIVFKLALGQTLFAALVSRGSPTYVAASDLQLSVGILQD